MKQSTFILYLLIGIGMLLVAANTLLYRHLLDPIELATREGQAISEKFIQALSEQDDRTLKALSQTNPFTSKYYQNQCKGKALLLAQNEFSTYYGQSLSNIDILVGLTGDEKAVNPRISFEHYDPQTGQTEQTTIILSVKEVNFLGSWKICGGTFALD